MNEFGRAERTAWSGRLGLTVASEPPQSFSASFDLQGEPEAGQLTLVSPLGSTLAVLEWSPGRAWLRQGQRVEQFDSVEAVTARATGAELPLSALFAWLRGQNEPVPGWRVDLSRLNEGRLLAQRLQPLPTAELRLALDDAAP